MAVEPKTKELPAGEHEQRRADWGLLKESLRDPISHEAMRSFYRSWEFAWHRGYDMGWMQRTASELSLSELATLAPEAPSKVASWDLLEQLITAKAQKVNNETKFDLHTVDELLLMAEVIGNLLSHAAAQDEEMYNHIIDWQTKRDQGPEAFPRDDYASQ